MLGWECLAPPLPVSFYLCLSRLYNVSCKQCLQKTKGGEEGRKALVTSVEVAEKVNEILV